MIELDWSKPIQTATLFMLHLLFVKRTKGKMIKESKWIYFSCHLDERMVCTQFMAQPFIIDYLAIINCCLHWSLWFAFGLGVAEAGYLRHFICRTPWFSVLPLVGRLTVGRTFLPRYNHPSLTQRLCFHQLLIKILATYIIMLDVDFSIECLAGFCDAFRIGDCWCRCEGIEIVAEIIYTVFIDINVGDK